MAKKKKDPLKSCCLLFIFALIVNLFFFGGLAPFFIASIILLPVLLICSLAKSKKNNDEVGPSLDTTSTQNLYPEQPSHQTTIQQEVVKPKYCSECGSPLETDICEFCGTKNS